MSKQAQANGTRELGSGNRVINHFTDLDAWKLAHELFLKIYKWTNEFPDSEKFGLVSQMRRSAISITSNIAEGFGRYQAADKKHFYIMARSSATELESQILVSRDLEFLFKEKADEGQKLCITVQKATNGLIKGMKNRLNPTPSSPIPIPQQ
ncbi:MAG: four helix bundle protein [Candidatus Peribacteraceae bacterium]|jgi:four helix bundle protein|nr:four helix bundle protein [Candidatus Peribacteraceae bacterium]MDP7454558.1 four helix bundle protein [Candidatus Peribacteraceae bacterium]MDP7646424.1 four helix bundle protein [Candidatus Peribacteraceae bacterium]